MLSQKGIKILLSSMTPHDQAWLFDEAAKRPKSPLSFDPPVWWSRPKHLEQTHTSHVVDSGSIVAVSLDPELPDDLVFAYGVSKYDWLYLNDSTDVEAFAIPCLPLGKLWVCADHIGLTAHSKPRYGEGSITLCNTTFLEANPSTCTIDGHPISHCLAEEVHERCAIPISTTILCLSS